MYVVNNPRDWSKSKPLSDKSHNNDFVIINHLWCDFDLNSFEVPKHFCF